MLDHIGFGVRDIRRSREFYLDALAPLGITIEMEVMPDDAGGHTHLGFGAEGKPFFWISDGEALSGRLHVAFAARSRAEVDAFYRAAIAAGGQDNGGPRLRPEYHPNYYAAFVLDFDGHNIEAVCHTPI
jgi:catechol 2,3-dioxygenase-like lactoylglutathione lyase family enzyme